MIQSKHHITFCKVCDRDTVICATCGNNVCNGGSGKVGTQPCPDCEEAWAHDQRQHEHKDVVFAGRKEPIQDTMKELLRPLSDEEYDAAPVPSKEEIKAAFAKSRETMLRARRKLRSGHVPQMAEGDALEASSCKFDSYRDYRSNLETKS